MLRGGRKHRRSCHNKSHNSSFALAGRCRATWEGFACGGEGLAPHPDRETEARVLGEGIQGVSWRTQPHSWSPTQWWQLRTGVAGRGRAWLGLRGGCSAARFQLAAPGPGSPSRPVPPSPAADASPCVLPSSSLGQRSEPRTTARPPAPLPYHEGPPARSNVLPARQAAPRSESPIAPLAGFPASFCPSHPPRPLGHYPSISLPSPGTCALRPPSPFSPYPLFLLHPLLPPPAPLPPQASSQPPLPSPCHPRASPPPARLLSPCTWPTWLLQHPTGAGGSCPCPPR